MKSKWYNKRASKKDIKDIRSFVRQFGVGMRFKKTLGGGEADIENNIIYIDPSVKKNLGDLVSMVLHELWHCICREQRLYPIYHCEEDPETYEELVNFRRTAFRAEVFVDKRAEKMMKEFFPGIKYTKAYRNLKDKKWYYDNYLDKYYSLEGKNG